VSKEKPKGEGYLATGPRMWWSRSRPRLAVSSGPVAESKTPRKASWLFGSLRVILGVLLVLFVAVSAFWLVLGVTILPTVRADGDMWVVQRAAWPEGKAPTGATVLVLPAAVERGIVDRAELLVSSGEGNYVAQVIAQPGSEVTVDIDGKILVNGFITEFRTPPEVPVGSTGGNYLAVCLTETCGPVGYPVFVPADAVLGKVLGAIKPGGFGPFPSFAGIPE